MIKNVEIYALEWSCGAGRGHVLSTQSALMFGNAMEKGN